MNHNTPWPKERTGLVFRSSLNIFSCTNCMFELPALIFPLSLVVQNQQANTSDPVKKLSIVVQWLNGRFTPGSPGFKSPLGNLIIWKRCTHNLLFNLGCVQYLKKYLKVFKRSQGLTESNIKRKLEPMSEHQKIYQRY